MRLTLRMSSVQYVHTKRFQTELVAFFQHYLQLQEVLGRMRAVSEGNEVCYRPRFQTAVSIDSLRSTPEVCSMAYLPGGCCNLVVVHSNYFNHLVMIFSSLFNQL